MRYSGIQLYFQDPWNYIDCSQPLLYTLQIYLKLSMNPKNPWGNARFWYELVAIITLLQSAAKFMQLIRYNESFCFLVEMLIYVSSDIYPFLVVFFTFCGVFSLITFILEGGYSASDYPYMSIYPLLIIML